MPKYTNKDIRWAQRKLRAITHDPVLLRAIEEARAQARINDAVTKYQLRRMNALRPPPEQRGGPAHD